MFKARDLIKSAAKCKASLKCGQSSLPPLSKQAAAAAFTSSDSTVEVTNLAPNPSVSNVLSLKKALEKYERKQTGPTTYKAGVKPNPPSKGPAVTSTCSKPEALSKSAANCQAPLKSAPPASNKVAASPRHSSKSDKYRNPPQDFVRFIKPKAESSPKTSDSCQEKSQCNSGMFEFICHKLCILVKIL